MRTTTDGCACMYESIAPHVCVCAVTYLCMFGYFHHCFSYRLGPVFMEIISGEVAFKSFYKFLVHETCMWQYISQACVDLQ